MYTYTHICTHKGCYCGRVPKPGQFARRADQRCSDCDVPDQKCGLGAAEPKSCSSGTFIATYTGHSLDSVALSFSPPLLLLILLLLLLLLFFFCFFFFFFFFFFLFLLLFFFLLFFLFLLLFFSDLTLFCTSAATWQLGHHGKRRQGSLI